MVIKQNIKILKILLISVLKIQKTFQELYNTNHFLLLNFIKKSFQVQLC